MDNIFTLGPYSQRGFPWGLVYYGPMCLYGMVPCVCILWSTVFVCYGPMCLYAMVHCVCILGPTTVIRVVNMNLAILPYQGIAINQYQLY